MQYNYNYIIDTKLIWYQLQQTQQDPIQALNVIADILINEPRGKIYMVSDLGKSKYRLGISSYYKGKRAEEKARYTEEQKEAHHKFQREYELFVRNILPKLNATTMLVDDVEADDIASILCYSLAEDPTNRIVLVTRDQDWLHSVLDHDNVKILSTYLREPSMYSHTARQSYNVETRKEFSLRKALFGDGGDSILHPKYLGKVACTEIWDKCLADRPITLDKVHDYTMEFINAQKSPSKFTIPHEYEKQGVTTIRELLELNFKLAETMTSIMQLDYDQANQYTKSLQRVSSIALNPFDDGIALFGRPIVPNHNASRVFNIGF